MWCRAIVVLGAVVAMLGAAPIERARGQEITVPGSIVYAGDSSFAERLAAREIRRYVYLRTSRLLPLRDRLDWAGESPIIVGGKTRSIVRQTGVKVDDLGPEQYLLTTSTLKNRPFILVAGGDATGTLLRGISAGRATGRAVLS